MNLQSNKNFDIFIKKIKYFNFQNNYFYEIENAFKSYIKKEDYVINGVVLKYQEAKNIEDYIVMFLKEKIHSYLLTIEKYNKYINKKTKEYNLYGERVNSRNYGKNIYEITIKGFNFNLKKIKISELSYDKGEKEGIYVPKIIEDGFYYPKNLYSFDSSMNIKETLNNILIYNQKINFCFFFIKTLQENKNLFLNIESEKDIEDFFDKIKEGK